MSSVGWQNFFVLKAKNDAFLANLQGPVDLEDWPKKSTVALFLADFKFHGIIDLAPS